MDEDTVQAAWYDQEMQEYRRIQEEWDEYYAELKKYLNDLEERLWKTSFTD